MNPVNRAVEAPGVVFRVPDMSCGHCVAAIREALHEAMPEAAVSIDLEARRVSVFGDAAAAAAAIRDAGYEPTAMP
jgi:copper chaperone